jgi:hypothetical protein
MGILLSYLTSALGFYLSCRLVRFRREWAAAGALLWASLLSFLASNINTLAWCVLPGQRCASRFPTRNTHHGPTSGFGLGSRRASLPPCEQS